MDHARTFAAAILLLAFAPAVTARDLTGTWRYDYRGPEGRSFAEVTLVQEGDAVTGRSVEDGTRGRRWEACLKGRAERDRATVRACFTNQGGPGTTIPACPEYGPAEDQFVLVQGNLVWFQRNARSGKWDRYRTLRPAAHRPVMDADDCL